MRFSKVEAEREAIRLAERLVAADGGAGWTCLGASPNVLAPGYKKRKNIIKWSVAFDRSSGGVMIDGPVVVHVDIETGAADYF
ncbi:hypothetical protein [Paludisphaera sp.]|uniref:hypothetical protein n=1 Tax=Paludisphaera sp. TaxID=2017432 RepID=UPI00301CE73B